MSATLHSTWVPEPPPPGSKTGPNEWLYGGSLFFNLEEGRAGCGNPECGWSGVPTIVGGFGSTRCPACQHEPDDMPLEAAVTVKVARNQPCPCGSGRKAKKCCHG